MTPPCSVFLTQAAGVHPVWMRPCCFFLLYCNWLNRPVQSIGNGIVTGCCAATVRVTSG